MIDPMSTNLAGNLKRLREARGLAQQGLADLAGVPRPTLAHLESGAANPTLSVVLKVASALRASVEELVGAPQAVATLYRACSLQTRTRGRSVVRQLMPEPIPGVRIERLELPAGARLGALPGLPGTRQYLACESGVVELHDGTERWRLETGDVLVLGGGQPPSYVNRGRRTAVAYSVLVPAPAGA